MNNIRTSSRNRGLTLIELMIAMALSLLLMGGTIGIFVSSKQAHRTEDAMSRNQEAGRFAVNELTKNIRSAGYAGCSNLEDITPNVIASPAPPQGYAVNSTIIGYDGGTASATYSGGTWTNSSSINWVPGTDVITLSSGGDCGADLTGNMGVQNANIQLSNANSCGFQAGEALLITDCQTADLFRATNVSAATGKITIAHASGANTTNRLSRAYMDNATVLRFIQNTYFIGASPNGNPSLYRTNTNGTTEELVENVSGMQIVYGIDTGRDGVVDKYEKATAISDWTTVISAQISLLVRSDDNALSQPQSLTYNGSTVNGSTGADKRLRSVFNATASIRNRIP